MILRLQVSGFKNLVDVDVRFGPFTCIAGGNGVGKSNLIDAIQFLSQLADKELTEAIASIRGELSAPFTIDSFFFKVNNKAIDTITFTADILIPRKGQDQFGSELVAKTALLRYQLSIKRITSNKLEIVTEELRSLTPDESWDLIQEQKYLVEYAGTQPARTITFIDTQSKDGTIRLLLEDSYIPRRTSKRETMKQTLLSSAEPSLFPTAYLVRQEFLSWRAFHLEPTALRSPDFILKGDARLAASGKNLASTLSAMASASGDITVQSDLFQNIATQLSHLIGDVQSVGIDSDPIRNTYTVYLIDRQGNCHPARSLSDGTLRFLAMVILEQDSRSGVYCIEEPENGLHPKNIEAMLDLLQSIAVDPQYPIDHTNPLRQVIITTHSPVVVSLVPDDSLLYAELVRRHRNKNPVFIATFRWLKGTWRSRVTPDPRQTVARGSIFSYVAPIHLHGEDGSDSNVHPVIQNPDIQAMLRRAGGINEESATE